MTSPSSSIASQLSSPSLWLTVTCLACMCISIYALWRVNALEQSVVECMLQRLHNASQVNLSYPGGADDPASSEDEAEEQAMMPKPAAPDSPPRPTAGAVAGPSIVFHAVDMVELDRPPAAAPSVVITEAPAAPPPPRQSAPLPSIETLEGAAALADLSGPLESMKISDLKALAKTFGISTRKGTKDSLIQSIEEARRGVKEEAAAAAETAPAEEAGERDEV